MQEGLLVKKPISIGKISYRDAVKDFGENSFNYLEMIIGVLKEHYSEEYELLITLANEDNEIFKENSSKNKIHWHIFWVTVF